MQLEKAEIRVMRGPNFWSVDHHKLIILKIRVNGNGLSGLEKVRDIIRKEFIALPSSDVREKKHVPNDLAFDCAELTGQVARKLLETADMPSGFSGTYYIRENDSYNIVFAYEEEESARMAAQSAIDIVNAALKGETTSVAPIAKELRETAEYHAPGPSTSAIIKEAVKRNIPVTYLNSSLVAFGHGKYMKRIAGSMCDTTSIIGVDIAGNKDETKALLDRAFIPVPKGIIVRYSEDLDMAVEELGYPLVAKPLNGNHGNGITGNITNEQELKDAFARAQTISRDVIIEKFITGYDFRLLVVNYKLVAVARRTPAAVTGNGHSTIQELIDEVNSDPRRGEGHGNVMTKIIVDEITMDILRSKNLTLESIIPNGELLILKDTANMSTGGTACDITSTVHPDNIRLAERTAETVGLDICGIDIIAPDLTTPLTQNGGAVLEVNAAPGLRMHIAPSQGEAQPVGKAIVDMMFPPGAETRVPIIAITGTNGKTTTSRLMSHVCGAAGYKVGFTTTDGIYVAGKLVAKGDFTGPKSTEVVLTERSVDLAVLECARGGILRSGLAFDFCDIGIVTNVAEDHLGLKDIYTLQDMAKVKSVVAKAARPGGYAVLNADDDSTYKMAEHVRAKVAFFSMDPKSERIKKHVEKGGLAVVLKDGMITLLDGKTSYEIAKAEDIPLTLGGKVDFMIQNIMPVCISAHVLGISHEVLKNALKSFHPSADQTPGRLNMFKFSNFEVMVDYAHNTHSLEALSRYLAKVTDRHKVGIVTGVGDRRDEDIVSVGTRAAEMYDEIIIRIDSDTRGRTPDEISNLILSGIISVSSKHAKVIPDETEAITYAVRNAKPNTLIVISTEKVSQAIDVVEKLREEEEMQLSGK